MSDTTPQAKVSTLRLVVQQPIDVDINRVAIHPKNPKDHDLGMIDESFSANGFYGRIVIWQPAPDEVFLGEKLPENRDFWCLAGAGRIETALARGATTLPADLISARPEVAARILLVDNKANTAGGYKPDMLFDFLKAVVADGAERGISTERALAGSGYDGDDMDDLQRVLNPPPRREKTTSDEEAYLVVIDCDSEEEMNKTLQALVAEGYKARITE